MLRIGCRRLAARTHFLQRGRRTPTIGTGATDSTAAPVPVAAADASTAVAAASFPSAPSAAAFTDASTDRPDWAFRGDGHTITRAAASACGKFVDVGFRDGTRYRFHAAWLRDSSPANIGPDEYRLDPSLVFQLPGTTAAGARPAGGIVWSGEVEVDFCHDDAGDATTTTTATTTERFDARFLHAAAPFVGKRIRNDDGDERTDADADVTPPLLRDTGMVAGPARRGWEAAGFEIPAFDFDAITVSVDSHLAFLECVLFQPGVAFIRGVPPPPPEHLRDDLRVGAPLEAAALRLVGRLNQHTNRATRFSVTHAAADAAGRSVAEPIQKSMDYDCGVRLPMHTDHSQFPGMPGYLQFMQNLQGGVHSFVSDGLAVARYLEVHHPRDYELLTTVAVTHSFRNRLYTAAGAYRDIAVPEPAYPTAGHDPVDPYEVCHTHPIIELARDGSGAIERIAQSETKRGVCAIPFDVYEPFMAAYRRWTSLVEDPRFVHRFSWPENGVVVCNNYRVLHGRADLAPGDERTLVVGYTGKGITDNRFRMLCQQRAAACDAEHCRHLQGRAAAAAAPDPVWMSRLPNQVLSRMVVPFRDDGDGSDRR